MQGVSQSLQVDARLVLAFFGSAGIVFLPSRAVDPEGDDWGRSKKSSPFAAPVINAAGSKRLEAGSKRTGCGHGAVRDRKRWHCLTA